MYIIETHRGGQGILHEVTAAEFRKMQAEDTAPNYTRRRVDAAYAHRWVRNGNLHSTDLWVDGGRVRKAGVGC